MHLIFVFVLCSHLTLATARNNQVGVNNKIEGDQSVGGVHLFELHTPSGGTGYGVKLVVIGLIIGIIFYWCISKRVKKCQQAVIPYATAASNVSRVSQYALQDLAQVHPQPPVQLPRFAPQEAPRAQATATDPSDYRI